MSGETRFLQKTVTQIQNVREIATFDGSLYPIGCYYKTNNKTNARVSS